MNGRGGEQYTTPNETTHKFYVVPAWLNILSLVLTRNKIRFSGEKTSQLVKRNTQNDQGKNIMK